MKLTFDNLLEVCHIKSIGTSKAKNTLCITTTTPILHHNTARVEKVYELGVDNLNGFFFNLVKIVIT